MKPLALAACLTALACSSPQLDPNACQQSFGFGNYGCADVTGTVLNSANTPAAGVAISAGGVSDPYQHLETTSNGTGQFSMRLLRRWIPPESTPDTVTTWFHTMVPAAGGQPAVHDSAQVTVRFYPLLQRPTATTVTLQVSTP